MLLSQIYPFTPYIYFLILLGKTSYPPVFSLIFPHTLRVLFSFCYCHYVFPSIIGCFFVFLKKECRTFMIFFHNTLCNPHKYSPFIGLPAVNVRGILQLVYYRILLVHILVTMGFRFNLSMSVLFLLH